MTARPLDLRLAVPAAAAWLAVAVLPAVPLPACWWLVAAAVLTGAAAAVRHRWVLVAAAVGAAAGGATVGVHLTALRTGPVADAAGRHAQVDLRLRLVRDPAVVTGRGGRRLVVADATATAVRDAGGGWRADRAPVVVFVPGSGWLGLLPGQRLAATGRLLPPRAGDTVAAVVFADGDPHLLGRPPPWQRWAGGVRDGLRRACAALGSDERGLVPGLVLGDVSAMPPDLTAAFRATGLAHLNAVSGSNCAIVLGAVLAAVRRGGLGRRARAVVAGLALVAFVVLVRPSPSVLRAAVMGAVVLVAMVLGRRTSAVPVLAAAVLGLLVVDPFLGRSAGFAMSVLATAAIVTVAPGWTERLDGRLPRPVAAAVAVPAAAQLACTPVIVAAFGQVTPYAVLANLLAAPAVAPATLAGIGCALLAGVAPAPAALLAEVAAVPAWWLATVARSLAAAPGAGATLPAGVAGVGLLAAAALLVAAGWRRWHRRRRGSGTGRDILAGCRP